MPSEIQIYKAHYCLSNIIAEYIVKPVSYTHLDVYKRQLQGTAIKYSAVLLPENFLNP